MRVFLSWSGEVSQQVALALRDWLPSVIQSIEPYVSSEDIDKGARWGSEISKELAASDFGILCITASNPEAPWLNFEAGALSKSIESSRVVPLLFGLERSQLPQGPLVQFQSVLATRDDVKRLVVGINLACGDRGLDEARLDGVFDVWWPRLEAALADIKPEKASARRPSHRPDAEVLAELLELARAQQNVLNNPEALLPQSYIRAVMRRETRSRDRSEVNPAAVRDLSRRWRELTDALEQETVPPGVEQAVEGLRAPVLYLVDRFGAMTRWSSKSNGADEDEQPIGVQA